MDTTQLKSVLGLVVEMLKTANGIKPNTIETEAITLLTNLSNDPFLLALIAGLIGKL